jgi:hypothetical protein
LATFGEATFFIFLQMKYGEKRKQYLESLVFQLAKPEFDHVNFEYSVGMRLDMDDDDSNSILKGRIKVL